MPQRIFWLKFGGRRLHLLKLAGAFIVIGAVLKVAEAAYNIFVVTNKAIYAQLKPDLISQLFGWSINAPYSFSNEDVLGVLLGPTADFLFWLAIAVIALMVYQAGKIIFPIEEYEQKIVEHHRKLIEKAREAARKRKK